MADYQSRESLFTPRASRSSSRASCGSETSTESAPPINAMLDGCRHAAASKLDLLNACQAEDRCTPIDVAELQWRLTAFVESTVYQNMKHIRGLPSHEGGKGLDMLDIAATVAVDIQGLPHATARYLNEIVVKHIIERSFARADGTYAYVAIGQTQCDLGGISLEQRLANGEKVHDPHGSTTQEQKPQQMHAKTSGARCEVR